MIIDRVSLSKPSSLQLCNASLISVTKVTLFWVIFSGSLLTDRISRLVENEFIRADIMSDSIATIELDGLPGASNLNYETEGSE